MEGEVKKEKEESSKSVDKDVKPDLKMDDSKIESKSDDSNTPKLDSKKPIIDKKSMRLLIIISVILYILLIILFIFKLALNTMVQTDKIDNTTSSISPVFTFSVRAEYVTGDVWRLVDGRKVQLLEGDILKENDRIITEDKGRIVLLCDDGSVIRLGENTDVLLSSLKPQEIRLAEEFGVLFARVQKDETHKFIIAAGDITVVSEGTAFLVEKQDQVKVSVFESSVKVDDEGKEIEVGESQEWQEGTDKATTIDSKKLSKNEFVNWSLSEEKLSKIPTVTPVKVKEVSENVNQIKLTAKAVTGGINLNWTVNGIDVSKGFKLIKNTAGSPKYPGDTAIYLDANTREYSWKIEDESIWHIRVCQYTGEGCGAYSNEVELKALDGGQSSIKSISLSGIFEGGIAKLTWAVDGSSTMGYKVVWSKNSGPTYPLRDGDEFIYVSNPDEKSTKITGLSAGWDYHIRVCEYLGGKCGIYSNEITLKY